MNTLPQTVAEFNAVSDSDSRLAVELAIKLRGVPELLQAYGISRKALATKLRDPMFRAMVKQARALWQSDLSVKERIRLKSQILVEDSLLEVFSIFHNRDNAIPARLDAFTKLAKTAEVDQPERGKGETGSRFTVSINLGDTVQPVIIQGDSEE